MSVIGSAVVRIVPGMAGFGAAVGAGIAGSASALTKAGMGATVLLTAPIVAGFAVGIQQAVSFESGLAGVSKTTDLVGSDLTKLGEDVAGMANKMPFAREEILAVVEAAGRFGTANENLLEFSEVALQLGVAADGISAERITEELIKIANVTKLPDDQFRNMGDSLIYLGNNFPTTEGKIAHFSQRLSQISAVLPVTTADIMGLATGALSVGIRAEAGGTAFARSFMAISESVDLGGEKLEEFARIAGTTTDEFAAAWREDPTQAMLTFLEGLDRLNESGENTALTLKNMGAPFGDARVRDVLLRTAGGIDTVRAAVEGSNQAFKDGGDLQEEYDKRVDTTAAQWVIFKNNVSDVARIFGENLLPILNDTFVALTPIMEVVAELMKGFSALPEPVKMIVLGGLALLAIIGPMILIFGKVFSLLGMLGGVFVFLGKAMLFLGGKFVWLAAKAVVNSLIFYASVAGKMVLAMVIATAQAIATAAVVIGRLVAMAVTAVVQTAIFYTQLAVRMVAAWIISAAQAVASAAVVIARFVAMAVSAVVHTAIIYFQLATRMVSAFVTAAAQSVISAAIIVARFVAMAVAAVAQTAIIYFQLAVRLVAGFVIAAAQALVSAVIIIAQWVAMAIAATVNAGIMAVAWLIALGPIPWVIATIVGLAALIIWKWDDIKRVTGQVWDWIGSKIGSTVDFIVRKIGEAIEAAGRIKDAIAGIPGMGVLGNVVGAGGATLGGINSLFKANGGAVRKGGAYTVGERGKELFIPGASGQIVPNASMAGETQITINMGGVTIASGMDVVSTSRALARETAREMRAQGLTARTGMVGV